MHSSRFSGPDPERSRLRATVATIEREISRLPAPVADDPGTAHDLRAAFADLVRQLALGPEPEVRECPVCERICMRQATRCGHCWTKLRPPQEHTPPPAH
jgi:hypothetical protein